MRSVALADCGAIWGGVKIATRLAKHEVWEVPRGKSADRNQSPTASWGSAGCTGTSLDISSVGLSSSYWLQFQTKVKIVLQPCNSNSSPHSRPSSNFQYISIQIDFLISIPNSNVSYTDYVSFYASLVRCSHRVQRHKSAPVLRACEDTVCE